MSDAYEAECRKCGVTIEFASKPKASTWATRHNDEHEENGEDRQPILVSEVWR